MGDKPEFKQDVIMRLERIEKLLNERSTRKFSRTPVDATYENKKSTYLTKLNNKESLRPKQTTLEYYNIKYDENLFIIIILSSNNNECGR